MPRQIIEDLVGNEASSIKLQHSLQTLDRATTERDSSLTSTRAQSAFGVFPTACILDYTPFVNSGDIQSFFSNNLMSDKNV